MLLRLEPEFFGFGYPNTFRTEIRILLETVLRSDILVELLSKEKIRNFRSSSLDFGTEHSFLEPNIRFGLFDSQKIVR